MAADPEDFKLTSYDYDLPVERIAQFPPERPGTSRMLVMSRFDRQLPAIDVSFAELASHLPEQALIVANNSRVLPARLVGTRPRGGKVEFMSLTPLPLITGGRAGAGQAEMECLLKPGGKIKVGDVLRLTENLQATVIAKGEYGAHRVELAWKGNLEKIFNDFGAVPLPPYIHRPAGVVDRERYQTIYASKTGSVAAPTAGLHFTPAIRQALLAHGFEWSEITLHVGYGTFSPVRTQDIRQHAMHAEYVEISADVAAKIQAAKNSGRPIVAVGTTSLRTLEGVWAKYGEMRPFAGWIDIFLYPGATFHVADALLTNFHLPQSSLLMLVSAFASRSGIMAAYAQALNLGYRFFSYGDAMLIRP